MGMPMEACRLQYHESLEKQVSVKKKCRRRKLKKPSASMPEAFGTRDPTRKWKMNKLLRERALNATASSVLPILLEVPSAGNENDGNQRALERRFSFADALHTGLTPKEQNEEDVSLSPSSGQPSSMPHPDLTYSGCAASQSVDSIESNPSQIQNENTIQTSRFIEKHKARLTRRNRKQGSENSDRSHTSIPLQVAATLGYSVTPCEPAKRSRKSLIFELEHAESDAEREAILEELAIIDSDDDI